MNKTKNNVSFNVSMYNESSFISDEQWEKMLKWEKENHPESLKAFEDLMRKLSKM
ncbi:hypothetical protein OF364_01570 [Mycoplasma enhydrae]|uniref:hypothetical protein n=1 Tax=Mycoplasma enhydrae TaxID=2499220 RepID=UPI00197B48C7|nr:hypothetical protein [Mycoplasma enhydrae]MBN4089316.1 hypothetical protein [Mycoplasma enhydrae]MCV3753501.1 hypothetical protein [Mycoplasma enhydrae]